jgi:hypothetical protein
VGLRARNILDFIDNARCAAAKLRLQGSQLEESHGPDDWL